MQMQANTTKHVAHSCQNRKQYNVDLGICTSVHWVGECQSYRETTVIVKTPVIERFQEAIFKAFFV